MIVGTEAQAAADKMLGEGAILAANSDMVLYEGRDGKKLVMGELMEGLKKDSIMEAQTALLLENTRRYFANMDETTKLINIGDFEKFAYPMVRTIFPNLVGHELASVQVMNGPISLVFFMKFLYSLNKGSAVAGTDIVENPSEPYGSEDIDIEQVAEGDGSSTTVGTGTLAYTPVRPGTVVLTSLVSAAEVTITDDGNGNLIGDIGGGTSTINYVTGAIAVSWSSAPDALAPINAAYSYNLEANDAVPELEMQITSAPVQARPRKLRTKWSIEAQQDLKVLHGLNAEVEQVAATNNEMKFEIDREVVTDLDRIAASTIATWSKTPGAGISYAEHKLNFVDTLVLASNTIFSQTQRALGTWIVCGINVSSLIETLPGFVSLPRPKGTRAVYKAGTLNGTWDIWKDPNFGDDNYLMGYTSDNMWEVGYIFSPYLMGYTTATIMLDDFIARKALMSRYGKKVIEGKFYAKGSIST